MFKKQKQKMNEKSSAQTPKISLESAWLNSSEVIIIYALPELPCVQSIDLQDNKTLI